MMWSGLIRRCWLGSVLKIFCCRGGSELVGHVAIEELVLVPQHGMPDFVTRAPSQPRRIIETGVRGVDDDHFRPGGRHAPPTYLHQPHKPH